MGKKRLVSLEGVPVPPLSDVTSREDFLAREHFQDFRRAYMPLGITPASLSHLFHDCVDKEAGVYPGLVVVPRAELGWRAWDDSTVNPRTLSLGQYAVQAGSLIDVMTPLLRDRDELSAKELFLSSFVAIVDRQIA